MPTSPRREFWSLNREENGRVRVIDRTRELTADDVRLTGVSSFGEDAEGNLYLTDFRNRVYQFVAVPAVGDVDLDGDVDIPDFEALKAGFGGPGGRTDGEPNGGRRRHSS